MPDKSKNTFNLDSNKEASVNKLQNLSPVLKIAMILKTNSKADIWFSKAYSELRNELIHYYKELEKTLPDQEDKFFALWRLGDCYLRTENYIEFIKLYKRINKIYNQFNLKDITKELENDYDAYKEIFPDMLLEEISRKIITIYGNDPKLINAFVDAINYGLDDEPCLIIGETGTGKEIIAELIHKISSRKDNKFWPVNCGGFTESLFDSQINGIASGHATGVEANLGAFLNACGRHGDESNNGYHIDTKNKIKTIVLHIGGKPAENPTWEQLTSICGTLFLDEINSLPIGLQSGLLRIIQEKEVHVLGENKKRKYAAKVICATNKEFTGNEKDDGFRRDLYYRIAKGIIFVPPLREMKDSIPSIAKQIIDDKFNKLIKHNKIELSNDVADKLKRYQWPGNHRELENVLYRALKKMVLNNDHELKLEHIDFGRSPIEYQKESEFFKGKDLYQVNKMFVDYLLSQTSGNKAEAMRRGGFRSTKDIHEILNPKQKSYESTRFKNCKSLDYK